MCIVEFFSKESNWHSFLDQDKSYTHIWAIVFNGKHLLNVWQGNDKRFKYFPIHYLKTFSASRVQKNF